jgi:hypothetical protein
MSLIHTLLRYFAYDHSARRLLGYMNTGRVFLGVLIVFICCMSAFLASYVKYQDQLSDLSKTKLQAEVLESGATTIKKMEQASAMHSKEYQSFVDKKFDIAYSLDEIKSSIQNLQHRLKVQFLNSNFTVVVSEAAKKVRLSVYDVQFDIKVLQDQQFFQFIDKLCRDCPGLVEVKSFELKRLGSVTKEILNKVHDRKSILFDGKIVVRWTFFDKAKQAS